MGSRRTNTYEKGDRVGLFREWDGEGILTFLGYGVYDGWFRIKPTFEQIWQSFSSQLAGAEPTGTKDAAFEYYSSSIVSSPNGFENQRFTLDSGKKIWAFQCHDKPESLVEKLKEDAAKKGVITLEVEAEEMDMKILEEVT